MKTKHTPAKKTEEKIAEAEVLATAPSTALATTDTAPASQALALPESSALETVEGEAAADTQYQSAAYVGFRGLKSTSRVQELDGAGIKPLDFYLYDQEVIRVGPPFEVHVLTTFRSYTLRNQKNVLVGASMQLTREQKEAGYKENIDALVLVIVRAPNQPPSYVPALLQVAGAHAKCMKLPKELFDKAKDATEWAKRSPAHAVSAKATSAGARFIATIWTTSEDPIDPDGNPYNLGHAATRPTPESDVKAFNEWFAENYTSKVAPVFAAFQRRVVQKQQLAAKMGQ